MHDWKIFSDSTDNANNANLICTCTCCINWSFVHSTLLTLLVEAQYGPGSECGQSNTGNQYFGDPVHYLASQVAADADNDYLGLAVTSASDGGGKGGWQYRRGNWTLKSTIEESTIQGL